MQSLIRCKVPFRASTATGVTHGAMERVSTSILTNPIINIKISNAEITYIAEAKTGSFNSWDKPQTPPQTTGANNSSIAPGIRKWGGPTSLSGPHVQSSSGDARGPDGGSHSRSNSGDRFGTQAVGWGGGWAEAGTGGHRRSSGQAPDKPEGPEGRQRLYAHLIRLMTGTISAHSQKKKAETRYYQVRAMAQSPQYGRGTSRTRAILDTTLAEAKREMTSLQATLTENLEELANIPDFSEEKPMQQDPRKLMRMVIRYTEELQEWFQGLDFETRTSAKEPLTIPQKTSEREVTPTSVTIPNTLSSLPSISTPPTPSPSPSALTPQDLYNRGNWTWNEVKKALVLTQTQLQEIEEEIHSSLYTAFNNEQAREDLVHETDAMIAELTADLEYDEEEQEEQKDERSEDGELEDEQAKEARWIKRMEAYRDRFANALSHIYQANEEVDHKFRNDIVELSQLVRASNEIKQEVAAWRLQREELEGFCKEANEKLLEMESWNLQAIDMLDSLKEKAQHLAAMKEKITYSQQSVSTDPELDFYALVKYVQPILLQHIQHELQPPLEGLQERSTQYQEDMVVKIDSLVQPALQRTNELCAKAIAVKKHDTTMST